ncbi:hypothetical protein [Dyadobacter frigoris]|uniref:Uncharacterized protein n=1 Tax=Dyadobacter frigoris TaxID=2576211 RepID=A0A4U6D9A0_9BACT|nr:hypothetical protein [Dyadobacter frigoris]TKT94059.1 hypothetical protein FDK13_02285 [Dyadobacter frigoris]
MYFFDLPGFHPVNGVDTDDNGKYPYLHFKDTMFEKDDTNYIDSYFPFKNFTIAEGKTAFVSEKNLIAIFKYDPNFRDDLLIDHNHAVSKELLSSIKEDFHKGYLAGISDFPRQIQFAINLVDSPLKEIKLRNFIEFCGDHLFFEGFATPKCLYALGFIQAYLLKAFGEYHNLIQSIKHSLPKEKLEENISEEAVIEEAVQKDEIFKADLVEKNVPEEVVSAECVQGDLKIDTQLVEKNILEEVESIEAVKKNAIFKADLVEENVPEEIVSAECIQSDKDPHEQLVKKNILEKGASIEAVREDEIFKTDIVEENVFEEMPLSEAIHEDEISEADLPEENILEEKELTVDIDQDEKLLVNIEETKAMGGMSNVFAHFPTKEVEKVRFERISLDCPTDEIISLWMILLEVWKCKPVNSIQVFFEPKEILDLLGSMFDDSTKKRILPKSKHKYYNLPPGKYDRIINLLMHVTYKFNTDRNNINLEKYCEALIGTFSCYSKTKIASLKSNINKERGNIVQSIKSLPESHYKKDFFEVLGKINEYKN